RSSSDRKLAAAPIARSSSTGGRAGQPASTSRAIAVPASGTSRKSGIVRAKRSECGQGSPTTSMLRRDHIIELDDLRRAGKRVSQYRARRPTSSERISGEPAQNAQRTTWVRDRVVSG